MIKVPRIYENKLLYVISLTLKSTTRLNFETSSQLTKGKYIDQDYVDVTSIALLIDCEDEILRGYDCCHDVRT